MKGPFGWVSGFDGSGNLGCELCEAGRHGAAGRCLALEVLCIRMRAWSWSWSRCRREAEAEADGREAAALLDRITAVDCLLGCLSKVIKAGIRKRIACWMLDVGRQDDQAGV